MTSNESFTASNSHYDIDLELVELAKYLSFWTNDPDISTNH
jgi:hypothetical protein